MALESKLPQTSEKAISESIRDTLNVLAYLYCHPKPQVVRVHTELPGYHLQIEDYHSKAREWVNAQ